MTAPTLLQGDCFEVLQQLEAESVDACVTDPPYGLSFMGKHWDKGVPDADMWRQVYRVLKPGAHLLSFFGTRTYHRGVVAVEDAGFEIRDQIGWLYGSGFPKSLDVSKAIDKAGAVDASALKADLARAVKSSGLTRKKIDSKCGFTMRYDASYEADPVGWGISLPSPAKWEKIRSVLNIDDRWDCLIDRVWRGRAGDVSSENGSMGGSNYERTEKGDPVTAPAQQWDGWGTALKPAWEPICVARKPLIGTVAQNVLEHGTGGINVDACRIGTEKVVTRHTSYGGENYEDGWSKNSSTGESTPHTGRFPANLIHDGSDEVLAEFAKHGERSSTRASGNKNEPKSGSGMFLQTPGVPGHDFRDTGTAARFFYTAKASKDDRNDGLHGTGQTNQHCTVKPTSLMRYLVRLATPKGGLVLDPFAGSGTTMIAAYREDCRGLGIELDPEYFKMANHRIDKATAQLRLGL